MTREEKIQHNRGRNDRRKIHPNPGWQLAKQRRLLPSLGNQLINGIAQEMEGMEIVDHSQVERVVNGFMCLMMVGEN